MGDDDDDNNTSLLIVNKVKKLDIKLEYAVK
jgi:hypothetical protein